MLSKAKKSVQFVAGVFITSILVVRFLLPETNSQIQYIFDDFDKNDLEKHALSNEIAEELNHKESAQKDVSSSIFGLEPELRRVKKHSNKKHIQTCPSKQSLEEVPASCLQWGKKPKYHSIYDSALGAVFIKNAPGPSAQMHGFRDILTMAIETNKAISINSFRRHKTDDDGRNLVSEKTGKPLQPDRMVPFGLRVDMETLCKFVNLRGPMEGRVDAVINFSDKQHFDNYTTYYKFAAEYLEQNYGIILDDRSLKKEPIVFGYRKMKYVRQLPRSFRNFPMMSGEDVNAFLNRQNLGYSNGKVIAIDHSFEWIYSAIETKNSNALHDNAYHLIDDGGTWYHKKSIRGISTAPIIADDRAQQEYQVNAPLYRDVIMATQHPEFIRDLAQEFIRSVMNGGEFIGAHWRFNPDDFFGSDMHKKDNDDLRMDSDLAEDIKKVLEDPMYRMIENVSETHIYER